MLSDWSVKENMGEARTEKLYLEKKGPAEKVHFSRAM